MISTSERPPAISRFLAAAGFADATIEPLAGDASSRSYARLVRPGAPSLILMHAPPAAEQPVAPPGATPAQRGALGYNALARLAGGRVDAFAAIAQHLRALGLSAPQVYALDVRDGLAVLEDFGADLFATRIAEGAEAAPLYAEAIDALAVLHAAPVPATVQFEVGELRGLWAIPAYDALALNVGVDLFIEWWPRFAHRPEFDADARAAWRAAWAPVAMMGDADATAFTHRDFHAENLIWLPQRAGVARVGLLDFQDAVRAHPAWDLVSLIQDARREVAPALEARMLARYAAARGLTGDRFRADYAALAALNNLRIVGVFSRLVTRDAKPRYAAFMPRLWRLVAQNLLHPALAEARAWFAAHAPDAPC